MRKSLIFLCFSFLLVRCNQPYFRMNPILVNEETIINFPYTNSAILDQDKRFLLFSSYQRHPNISADLLLYNISEDTLTNLTNTPDVRETALFLLNNEQLFFTTDQSPYNIGLFNITTQETRLIQLPNKKKGTLVDLVGKQVSYIGIDNQIYLYDLTTDESVQVNKTWQILRNIKWSPNQTKVAYVSQPSQDSYELSVLDISSEVTNRIVLSPCILSLYNWTDDGHYLIYGSFCPSNKEGYVYILDTLTGAIIESSIEERIDFQITVIPGESMFLYADKPSEKSEFFDIFLFNITQNTIQNLTQTPNENEYSPVAISLYKFGYWAGISHVQDRFVIFDQETKTFELTAQIDQTKVITFK